MALVLLLLILAFVGGGGGWLAAAIAAQVLVMTAPGLFRPWARAWFGAAHALGIVSSALLMSLVFLVLVTPVGLVRRVMGKDRLRLRQFRSQRGTTVMEERRHRFSAVDLERPY